MTINENQTSENRVMVHLSRERGKAPNFTHYMQLFINDRVSSENLLNKKYFIFDENGKVSNELQSKELASDMKQIWYSKGRIQDVENISDEEFQKFATRMMKVISGKEELHITANVIIKDNIIYAFKI